MAWQLSGNGYVVHFGNQIHVHLTVNEMNEEVELVIAQSHLPHITIVPLRVIHIAQQCGFIGRDGRDMSTRDIQGIALPPTSRHCGVACTESGIVIALGTSIDH